MLHSAARLQHSLGHPATASLAACMGRGGGGHTTVPYRCTAQGAGHMPAGHTLVVSTCTWRQPPHDACTMETFCCTLRISNTSKKQPHCSCATVLPTTGTSFQPLLGICMDLGRLPDMELAVLRFGVSGLCLAAGSQSHPNTQVIMNTFITARSGGTVHPGAQI